MQHSKLLICIDKVNTHKTLEVSSIIPIFWRRKLRYKEGEEPKVAETRLDPSTTGSQRNKHK